MKANKKRIKLFRTGLLTGLIATLIVASFGFKSSTKSCHKTNLNKEGVKVLESKGCVFNTLFGETPLEKEFFLETSTEVQSSLSEGLSWMSKAQHENGGWGAGGHAFQNVTDPHAVQPDPATTSMVAMALLRCNNTLEKGAYKEELGRALNFLLETVENVSDENPFITNQRNTQIQSKLGQHIDAVMTAQFLTNLSGKLKNNHKLKKRVTAAAEKCIERIQSAQNEDGSFSGEGWAGVLQSAYANNALESAQDIGIEVNEESLQKSRDYQQGNVDAKSGAVKTERGAGVLLYAVSGSTRASAKDARKAREVIEEAKASGKLKEDEEINVDNLKKIGVTTTDAFKYSTAYEVYESANKIATRNDVIKGYGNNGGEEFLSFLQTGESMIINKDDQWKNWYSNTSGNLLNIQNDNGSWNGHHCITSPVFCTATCLLILSVSNDIEALVKLGM